MQAADWKAAMANSSAAENSALTTIMPRWPSIDDGRPAAWETYDLEIPAEIHQTISGMDRKFAILVAAYAKVASVLTGTRSVSVGYRSAGGAEPRLLRVPARDGSWLDLVERSAEALRSLGSERGAANFETVLDVTGDDGDETAHDGQVLRWTLVTGNHTPTLRMKYRSDHYGEECIARYAGYYVRALRLLVADPAAAHHERSLVSAPELATQLRDFAGPVAALPEKPFHQLFAEQARKTPDAPAVRCGDRECTYRELDRLANRVANALLERGLLAESIVAVRLPRSIEWIASIIGIFRAGGAYLPVDPDWPPDRLRGILKQARPRILLLDRGAEDIGDALGDASHALTIDAAITHPADNDPGVGVAPNQLAYIYFTSGSTGAPKGAMCEFAGMMNHLLAKLEDLDITAGDMLIQNAPATFDISLWQAIAPLLVGAATTVVSADTVRDIDAFIAEIDNVGATVLQVVPSYLDVLTARLSELERVRRLPTVRHVVVTGEALKKGLVEQWFELCDIPLTNAYGATEASDDTTHHLMRRPPESASVPVGRPVRNVRILVVDDHLRVLPLGAPGEIVFVGVCVGRGYVNDAERTMAAFVDSRTDPPLRMYRTGDYGRWRPDGVLDFHGRRDEQVKVRGFRVELGEIENVMRRIDGVREAAVVVRQGANPEAGLVGYYTSASTIEPENLRETLVELLPEYMIPAHLYRISRMPLTENSKIDKKALANQPRVERTERAAPLTDTEQMLAGLWAELLGLSRSSIGRSDQFFDRGGSSLSAIRLVVKLGNQVSLLDVAQSPVLSDLAMLIDRKKGR